MGFLSRLLIPRSARRAVHPARAVRRAVTPRSVKKIQRSIHPLSNARYSVERSVSTQIRSAARGGRTRRNAAQVRSVSTQVRSAAKSGRTGRSAGQVYLHAGCSVQHRSPEAAARCRNGSGSPTRVKQPLPGAQRYDDASRDLMEVLFRSLDGVTSEESVDSFAICAVQDIRAAQAGTSEFSVEEFCKTFACAVADKVLADIEAGENEVAEVQQEGEAASEELTQRLRAAVAAGDQVPGPMRLQSVSRTAICNSRQ
jgi:hypothetical protein